MQKAEAQMLFMRAVIRARETSLIEAWDTESLHGVYCVSRYPGITLDAWITLMEYKIDAPPLTESEMEQQNDAAIHMLKHCDAPVTFETAPIPPSK